MCPRLNKVKKKSLGAGRFTCLLLNKVSRCLRLEIAAILISFDKHSEWQSKEVKIREKSELCRPRPHPARFNCHSGADCADARFAFEMGHLPSTVVSITPKSGSMLLYSRKKVRYRRDGYCWKKRKDGKTTREDHMKLKVQGTEDHSTRTKVWFSKAKLKGSGYTLSEFLTKTRHDVFMAARQRVGVARCWTRDGCVVVQGADGKQSRVVTLAELNQVCPATQLHGAGGGVAPKPSSRADKPVATTARPQRASKK
ncbi:unnamed protein product [Plutella xylostella]|uniref:(diamondback moth) hypothetical protein n=1 Tax=Plutella xylostella TaxID=51655 RepID=A0A8S4FEM2_PLUXY|nr:unnamed protein product [Plutella xylostella]